MLNKLIHEYTTAALITELEGKAETPILIKALNNVASYLSQYNWKCNPATILDNKIWAMNMFFDMFVREIGGSGPAMMCYYFSSLVAKDYSLTEESRLEGNKIRAFVIYFNLNKWNYIFRRVIFAPKTEYKGHLDKDSFLDILLLGDVYMAWDISPNSALLAKLKKQAPTIARNHPNITRQQTVIESELAHEAVFEIIKTLVTL